MMKLKINYIAAVSIMIIASMVVFTACKEEIVGPEAGPIKAEIKQVIVNNSVYDTEFLEEIDTDGIDTIIVTIPQGTDVTSLDLDMIYSYFGEMTPAAGITDLTNPVTYTVTSNVETRDYLIMAKVVPPSLSSFLMTSPLQVTTKIEGDSIMMEVPQGVSLTNVSFIAEFFGESIDPSMDRTIDLSVEKPTISVINKEFETVYTFYVEIQKKIEFTGFIYDGTEHPNVEFPGSIASEDSTFITINDAEGAVLGGKAARFTNLVYDGNKTGSVNWDFGDIGLDDEPDEITIIMRGRGYQTNPSDHRYVEIVLYLGVKRFQFWVTLDKGLDGTGWGETQFADIAQGLDPFVWNTYRITANRITSEVKLYLNENPDPLPEFTPLSMETKGSELKYKAGFGDGSGGNSYDGEYDYFIIETGGAYSPEDLPLSKIPGLSK